MSKRVIVIGGGVSGLSTGVYLKKCGYDVLVLEKNTVVGGACIGWERKGCYIDGCIHWLVGTKKSSITRRLWEEVGALEESSEIYFPEDFYTLDFGGDKSFTVWTDIKRLEQELISFAPEDERQIKRFIKLIKRFQRIDAPVEKPADMMNLFELMKVGFTMAGDYYHIKRTSRISCENYSKKFKNPHLAKWIAEHMSSNYNFMSFLYMLAHVTSGDGGIPAGGSLPMAERVLDKYLSLGGEIRYRAEVERVELEGDRAVGVTLKSGERIDADWVVSTTPLEHTLKKLLSDKYLVPKAELRLKNRRTYPIYTYTTAVFKVNADLSDKPISHKIYFDEPIVMEKDCRAVVYRNYSYDKTMKIPEGCSVVQATIGGNDDTYFWWENVKNSGQYKAKKMEIANLMLKEYLKKYPELEGKIEILDVFTPTTYQRYLNGRHGSFQAFVQTAGAKAMMQKGVIKGLSGFILSGQWILQSGGLPTAVITARFAAQRICKKDKIKFTAN